LTSQSERCIIAIRVGVFSFGRQLEMFWYEEEVSDSEGLVREDEEVIFGKQGVCSTRDLSKRQRTKYSKGGE
jgi:hypothetical protein